MKKSKLVSLLLLSAAFVMASCTTERSASSSSKPATSNPPATSQPASEPAVTSEPKSEPAQTSEEKSQPAQTSQEQSQPVQTSEPASQPAQTSEELPPVESSDEPVESSDVVLDEWKLVVNGTKEVEMTPNPSPAPGSIEYMALGVDLKVGDKVTVQLGAQYKLGYENVKAGAKKNVNEGTDGEIVIKTEGLHSFYVELADLAQDNIGERIWVEAPAVDPGSSEVVPEGCVVTVTLSSELATWWGNDGAETRIHYWGDAIENSEWPGVKMNGTGPFTYELPVGAEGFLITRVVGGRAYNKTADILVQDVDSIEVELTNENVEEIHYEDSSEEPASVEPSSEPVSVDPSSEPVSQEDSSEEVVASWKLVVNGTKEVDMTLNPTPAPGSIEYMALGVDLKVGDKVKVVLGEDYDLGYSNVKADCIAVVDEGTSNAIVIKTAGVHDFYLETADLTKDNIGKRIWITAPAAEPESSGEASVPTSEPAEGIALTVTLDVSWWHDSGALTYVHYWGDAIENSTWPGVQMTGEVSGNVFTYTLPEGTDGFLVVRVNPSTKAAWNKLNADQVVGEQTSISLTITEGMLVST